MTFAQPNQILSKGVIMKKKLVRLLSLIDVILFVKYHSNQPCQHFHYYIKQFFHKQKLQSLQSMIGNIFATLSSFWSHKIVAVSETTCNGNVCHQRQLAGTVQSFLVSPTITR